MNPDISQNKPAPFKSPRYNDSQSNISGDENGVEYLRLWRENVFILMRPYRFRLANNLDATIYPLNAEGIKADVEAWVNGGDKRLNELLHQANNYWIVAVGISDEKVHLMFWSKDDPSFVVWLLKYRFDVALTVVDTIFYLNRAYQPGEGGWCALRRAIAERISPKISFLLTKPVDKGDGTT
jgi:hypothetical protein